MVEFKDLIPVFDAEFQCGSPVIIAGPCSAESRAQTLRTAEELASAGIRYFRAGVWKPRTRPGSFEGVGAKALPWLAEVREKTDMTPMTEIASPAHLRNALRAGICTVWIGARTAANPFAVQEIADFLVQLPAHRADVYLGFPLPLEKKKHIEDIDSLWHTMLCSTSSVLMSL